MIGQILPFFICHHPNGKVGVNIIQPGFKSLRVSGMAVQPGRNNSAAGGIVPAINTVRIRHATGGTSVPGEICSILSERPAEPERCGWVHPRIGAGIKIMEPVPMGMGNGIVS